MHIKKLSALVLATQFYLSNAALTFAQTPVPDPGGGRQIGGCDADDQVCQLGYNTADGFGNVLSKVIQFIFIVAVILALGFLVYGGIRWLTSGGDKDSVAQARGTIIAAIIGLIIIFLSYFILNFILLFLTGTGLDAISVPRIVG